MTAHEPTETCPACARTSRYLTSWEFSGLGESIFNYVADYYSCDTCGLVYIHNIDDNRLARFYSEECSYFSKSHFDATSPENIEKYTVYKDFIVAQGLNLVNVTDIGCGRGGFLTWLKKNDWDAECCGVDIDLKSIPSNIDDTSEIKFKYGGVLDLPFDSGTQSLLTYFHVLEHIRGIDKLLAEAFRVLESNGFLLIEVPNAESYAKKPIGSAFWLTIREHINHFSANALIHALHRWGFSVIKVVREMLPIPEFTYPSLMVLAKKSADQCSIQIPSSGDIASFALESKRALAKQVQEVSSLIADSRRVTFWGFSEELLSLLPQLDLGNCVFCDGSKVKQQSKYKHFTIHEPADIKPEGLLIVAPYLHGAKIEKAALDLGWQQGAIYRLK
jgi:ubiquinone/menaquinone biosynthesis C-methylase UbiE